MNCETLTSQWFVPRGLQLQTEAFSTPSFVGNYVQDVKKKRKEKKKEQEKREKMRQRSLTGRLKPFALSKQLVQRFK